ncbi:unnamed protein product [Dicrocoelium dendriticum]|nr:unnamed protein product [Dicrocoelium dendriticum]
MFALLQYVSHAGTSGNVAETEKRACLYTNAQCLSNKLAELKDRQASGSYDVAGITETWLHTGMTDAEVSLPGKSLIRNDRLTKEGGVILYYRNDLQCEAVEDSDSQFPDSIWCRLQLKGRDACLIVLVYRASNSTPETDYHLSAALRCSLQQKYTHIIIMGDFNVHCLEALATIGEQFKTDLQDLVTTVPLYNHSTLPTRFRTGNRPSVLDLVLTNEEHMTDALVLDFPLGRSDHAVISFNFVCYADYLNENDETVRTITRYDRLSQLVSATAWSFLEENPPEVAWLEFVNTFSQLIAQASEIQACNRGLTHIKFTAEAALQKLTSPRKHSSPGVDTIRPGALGAAASQLAGPLAQFFQRCLDQNQVPAMWKLGILTPIHKGGSRTDPLTTAQ